MAYVPQAFFGTGFDDDVWVAFFQSSAHIRNRLHLCLAGAKAPAVFTFLSGKRVGDVGLRKPDKYVSIVVHHTDAKAPKATMVGGNYHLFGSLKIVPIGNDGVHAYNDMVFGETGFY